MLSETNLSRPQDAKSNDGNEKQPLLVQQQGIVVGHGGGGDPAAYRYEPYHHLSAVSLTKVLQGSTTKVLQGNQTFGRRAFFRTLPQSG